MHIYAHLTLQFDNDKMGVMCNGSKPVRRVPVVLLHFMTILFAPQIQQTPTSFMPFRISGYQKLGSHVHYRRSVVLDGYVVGAPGHFDTLRHIIA